MLAATGADVMACETVPSLPEVRALLRLVESSARWTWISLSCRDDAHLSDGTPIQDVARACDTVERVAAVGINCVSPGWVPALVTAIRQATDKPIVVYPNSGETYDAARKVWTGHVEPGDWPVTEWTRSGASAVGGCCRVMPAAIAGIRDRLATARESDTVET